MSAVATTTSENAKKGAHFENTVGYASLLTFIILGLAWFVGFASRLFAIVRFESIIHEFDPWFNYRATHYMVENDFYKFLNWFDERAWYPLGRIVGGTVYPGLMITSGVIHYVLSCLNIVVHIRDVCVFLAPIFSGLTAIATYLLTKELWSAGAGLFAACFIAISPGYTSRSVAGSYDNEGIAIFALQFTYFLWVKSVKTGSVFWSVLTAISYFYMVSAWGGYVFIINLIPLHVLVLLISGNYSNKIYVAFTTFYSLGQLMAMQVPFVGFQPVKTSEHMAAFGVFGLLQIVGAVKYLQSRLTKKQSISLLVGTITVTLVSGIFVIALLTYTGYIAPWSGRFYSLWDTGYAKIHIPIIASVSEHQPTTWVSFFFDLHITAAVFPAGLWFCVKNVNNERVFVILYAVTAVYFAGVMVRLMLTLTPVVCILAGIAFSNVFEKYMTEEDESKSRNGEQLKQTKGMGRAPLKMEYTQYLRELKMFALKNHRVVETEKDLEELELDFIEHYYRNQEKLSCRCARHAQIDGWGDYDGENEGYDGSEQMEESMEAERRDISHSIVEHTEESMEIEETIEFQDANDYIINENTNDNNEKNKFEMTIKQEPNKHRRLYDKAGKNKQKTAGGATSTLTSVEESADHIGINVRSIVLVALLFILLMYVVHCTYVTSNAYSHPSVVLQTHTSDGGRTIMDDFREAYHWLHENTADNARVMSWWDYGYQIAGMANRTTLVDNNTWNNSHIALVGMAMSSNETFAYQIMRDLDVDYVLVIFGGVIGYSGDDINKFLWMVRIAEGEHPHIIREADYFTANGEYSVGAQASETMLNSIMYKMSYYRFGELRTAYNQPGGFDRTRNYVIGRKNIKLEYLEEAYTTENWLVRIFKVVHPHNRPNIKYQDRKIKTKKSPTLSKKSKSSKKGSLRSVPTAAPTGTAKSASNGKSTGGKA